MEPTTFSFFEEAGISIDMKEAKVFPGSKYSVDFCYVCCYCYYCIPKVKFLKELDEFLMSKADMVNEMLPIFHTPPEKLPVGCFLLDARRTISDTFVEVTKVKTLFWLNNKRMFAEDFLDEHHKTTTTLDLLIEKAETFYAEWEKRFAPFFPSPAPQPRDNELETSMPTTKDEDLLERRTLDLYSCNLFPRNYDFKMLCSCQECIPKINHLKDFEGFILSIYKLVLVVLIRCEQANYYCDNILYAIDWSERALDSYLFSLKDVYGKLNEDFTEGGRGLKHKIEIVKLYKFLAKSGLYPIYEDVPDAEFVNKTIDPFAEYINTNIGSRGMHFFENTKFREEGQQLLQKILEIEDKYQNAKNAADNRKRINPSISKSFILQQIECLEKLPVKGLCTEAEACIANASDIILKKRYVGGAKSSISDMCRDMALVRRALWRKNKKWRKGKKGDGGHALTGLSTTLDLLREKAKAFKADWDEHFARFFPLPTDQPRDN